MECDIFKTEILLCSQRKYFSNLYQINIMDTSIKVFNYGERNKKQNAKQNRKME